MDNFLEGGVEQLEAVKAASADLAKKEQEYKDTERSLKAKQKELEIQRKRVEEKVSSSIKKARAELEKGYDEKIGIADKAIKEAELKRKNAKAEAVSLRMKLENSSLVDENKILGAEIKSRFKEAKVPGLCNHRLYYALFSPNKKIDYLICIIGILICAGVIPFIVTRFMPTTFLKVMVWILIIVFFAAVYFLIMAWTKKGQRNEMLNLMRPNVERISDNKRFIKKRNKNIKADPDESQYNLTEYDVQLSAAKEEHDQAVSDKNAALQEFENVTSLDIREKLEAEKAPVFQELEKEIDQMQDDLQIRKDSYQEALTVMEDYISDLGDKNTKADKLDELISIISEGRAVNIQEALEVQKNKKKWRQTDTEDQTDTMEETTDGTAAPMTETAEQSQTDNPMNTDTTDTTDMSSPTGTNTTDTSSPVSTNTTDTDNPMNTNTTDTGNPMNTETTDTVGQMNNDTVNTTETAGQTFNFVTDPKITLELYPEDAQPAEESGQDGPVS